MIKKLIIFAIAICVLGFGAFRVSRLLTAKPTPAPAAMPDLHPGWKTGTLKRAGVTFRYPTNWTLKDQAAGAYTDFAKLQDATGFTIDLDTFPVDSQVALLGGSLGATMFNTTVGKYQLFGKPVYLLDDATATYSGTTLSACNGDRKCLVAVPGKALDLEATIYYNVPGKTDHSGGPDGFDPGLPAYLEAYTIATSLN